MTPNKYENISHGKYRYLFDITNINIFLFIGNQTQDSRYFNTLLC